MTIEDAPKEHIGPLRRVGQVISWVFGLFFILGGIGSLIGKSDPGSLSLGLGGLAVGAVLIPPIVTQIRRQLPGLKPVWAPPLLAVGLLVVSSIIHSSLTPKTPEELRAEQQAAAKAGVEAAAKDKAEQRARVDRYNADLEELLPRIEAVEAKKPADMAAVTETLDLFDKAAKALEDGKDYADDPAALAVMQKLRKALAARQQAVLPLLRAGYGGVMDGRLWEDNVDVFVQGPGNRRIRFVGVWFAANRNIAQVQGAARESLQRLRFTRSQYEWYRGSEYSYYDLETPADSVIGYWNVASFTVVPAPQPASSGATPSKTNSH